MSPSQRLDLPPEILDLIADHLCTELDTLKVCCLVSRSWVWRTRRYLFAHVRFGSAGGPSFESWMELFSDLSTSPSHHTRSLAFHGFPVNGIDAAGAPACIRSFRSVVELEVVTLGWDGRTSLAPLHGLSPTLKSLSLRYRHLPLSEVLNLICSFPLLEDLALNHFSLNGDSKGWDVPSTSPKLTGTLALDNNHPPIVRGLLSLPNGLHFSKITLYRPVEDAGSVMELVSRCSGTLESLGVGYSYRGMLDTTPPFDLSKHSKLKDIEFHVGCSSIKWIIMTLQASKPESLQRISIRGYCISTERLGEIRREWRDLDRLLSRLWTLHSIVPEVTCVRCSKDLVRRLLPELSGRGVVCDFQ